MAIIKATKKPVVESIEAVLWTGENEEEVQEFLRHGTFSYGGYVKGRYVEIGTALGLKIAAIGDYITKDAEGDFYPCKPDIFKQTYDF